MPWNIGIAKEAFASKPCWQEAVDKLRWFQEKKGTHYELSMNDNDEVIFYHIIHITSSYGTRLKFYYDPYTTEPILIADTLDTKIPTKMSFSSKINTEEAFTNLCSKSNSHILIKFSIKKITKIITINLFMKHLAYIVSRNM